MDLTSIAKIWNVIVYSNTFNFIVFVAIIAWIVVKIDVKSAITSLQQKIIKIIEDVKKEHEDALSALKNAEKAVEKLPEELDGIMQDAAKSAETISRKILTEAEKQLESIETNAKKVIDAEEKLLISKLTKSTSSLSVDTAQKHIQNVLVETPTLHEKYINESIDELDRLKW